MKKKGPDNDELRPHYDFDYEKMKPNRFAGEKKVYKQSTVRLIDRFLRMTRRFFQAG